MRLAMAQVRMSTSVKENLEKSLLYIRQASEAGADLIFFPEIQLSPFFPQYEKRDASVWAMSLDGPEVSAFRDVCRKSHIYASPNLYLEQSGHCYDASLMIDADGEILGVSKMVHISQAQYFYEQDYYTPSEDGFKVYETSWGKVGIVICFDRHLPDGIRSCAQQGADLVIIPTANILGEPIELFEWEIRVQAFQNTVFAAMCNRIGTEDAMNFAGQSLLVAPNGDLLYKAGDREEMLILDMPLEAVDRERRKRSWLTL